MDVAYYYYTRVPNDCFIQRTTATFIKKSIGHIGMLYKKMYLTIPLRLCRRPLYAYINWCGSVLNRLFYQQPISICTIKYVCILLSVACTVNFPRINDSWFLIPPIFCIFRKRPSNTVVSYWRGQTALWMALAWGRTQPHLFNFLFSGIKTSAVRILLSLILDFS